MQRQSYVKPSLPKYAEISFFMKKNTGEYRIYNPEKDGEWIVDKSGAHLVGETSYREDLVKTSLGLERDLEEHLLKNLGQLEEGLALYSEKERAFAGRQFDTDVGRIDILAVDGEGNFVVIELKAGTAGEEALGQILGYIRWVRINMGAPQGKGVTGIIVANDFDERLRYAASEVPIVSLKRYEVKFDFRDEPEVND